MSGTLEKVGEAKFVRWLKKNKIKQKKKAYGELLDRWIFLPMGHLFIVEFKRKKGGVLKRRQIIEINELKELGYDVEVHDDADEAIEAVRRRMEAQRLPEKSREVHARELLCWDVPRSRTGEDQYKPCRPKSSTPPKPR
jgi:hypothetical protein